MERPSLVAVAVVSAVAALAGVACRPPAVPCSAAVGCDGASACVGGACKTERDLPPPHAERLVLVPRAVAFARTGAPPGSPRARLGGAREGKLFLRFDAPPFEPERLLAAHLVLGRAGPAPLGEGDGDGVVLTVERIADPWEEASVTTVSQPRTFELTAPRVRDDGRSATLRLDVRELVARWPTARDHGLAVVGQGAPPFDVALAAADGAVPEPRLELYFVQKPPSGTAARPTTSCYTRDAMLFSSSVASFSRIRSSAPFLALAVASASCSRSEAAEAHGDKAAVATTTQAVRLAEGEKKPVTKVEKKEFSAEMSAIGACKVGAECKVEIALEARGDFHVNKEYPHKFTAEAAPGVTFLGKPEAPDCPGSPQVFRACAGDFKLSGAMKGTMSVRFRPDKAGTVTVRGPYKFSVCSDMNCLIDTQVFALDVRVE